MTIEPWPWLINWHWALQLQKDWQRIAQARRIRAKRGARQRAQLAPIAERLERALLESYRKLDRDIIASLRGRSDDIASGRFHQSVSDEARAVLEYYDIPEDEADHPVDRTREAAILLLLALWRRRYQAIAEEEAGTTFRMGRLEALDQLGLENAVASRDTSALKDVVLQRFDADVDRLENGLRGGTLRGPGIEAILGSATTLATAASELRSLFDEEEFRIQMYAEAFVWGSWMSGFRAGAVDGSRQLKGEGGGPDQLPRFVWSGPFDARTCNRCTAQFGDPVAALSVDDLPDPTEICVAGRSCRHYWELAQ